ncbi:MAG: DUF1848 domain-containing protein [Thermanaerothrix sp.]|uniref:DUF1848 domain-containing protein n=1 Tax=Thermanaerothrix sp. TaxID=2972675 RepID=UPI003C7E5820
MIISASRRTDIPAFYTPWFINRVRAGYCTVPNPFNRRQVSYVSLRPAEMDVIVFWTRNPAPLIPYLDELDERGLRYYFQYTVLDNPRALDPKSPPLPAALNTFRRLAEKIGPQKVIWRYDPIVFTPHTDAAFHRDAFARIAAALHGYTRRVVISILDRYPKAAKRLAALEPHGYPLDEEVIQTPAFEHLVRDLVALAAQHEMEIVSCAEDIDLRPYGVRPGKCVDDDYIRRVFGIEVTHTKDPHQREACGCVVSKDIGAYDTCLFGCQYCYATRSFDRARQQHAMHNPESPSLIGWYEAPPPTKDETPTPDAQQLGFDFVNRREDEHDLA